MHAPDDDEADRDVTLTFGVPEPLPNELRDPPPGYLGVYLGRGPVASSGVRRAPRRRAERAFAVMMAVLLAGRLMTLPWPWVARLAVLLGLGGLAVAARRASPLSETRIAAARERARRELIERRARNTPESALSRVEPRDGDAVDRGLSRGE